MLCTRMTTLAGLVGTFFFSKKPFLVFWIGNSALSNVLPLPLQWASITELDMHPNCDLLWR